MVATPPGQTGKQAGAPAFGRVLRLAASLAALLAVGPFLLRAGPSPPVSFARDPIDIGGLPEISSHGGLLEATLTAAPLSVTIGGATFAGAGFNGIYGGPVLRAWPGDHVKLHLVNHLGDAINLHFHGLRVSPLAHGDNMQILVQPGQSFDYSFRIPLNHPAGLFWYHDHAHRRAEAHVMAGLSGALLIEGFARQFSGLAGTKQRLLVLKDWQQPDCSGAVLKTLLHCRVVSINGSANWAAQLAPGATELWRISNQGANQTIHLAAPGLHWRVIGRDSLPAQSGRETGGVDIMPSSRADVLVRADAAGLFALQAVGVPTTGPAGFSIRRNLGSVTVAGGQQPASPLVAIPRQQDMRGWRIDANRTIVFSENVDLDTYFINGRQFDPRRTDYTVPLGSVEAWTIRNETDDFHEFHIHQLSFQVTDINGVRQTKAVYADTVDVPARGEVKLIIPFTDPNIVGHIMFHCHVLNHEDHGMMAMLEVYAPWGRICRVPN